MKVFVITSDWYNPLIPGFAYLFNKFWSADQPVTFLGYTVPDYELPQNFSFESLGPGTDFANYRTEWSYVGRGSEFSDSLKGWLSRMPDPYFILLLIDYFIHQPVSRRQLDILEKHIQRDNVMKIDLSLDRIYFAHSRYDDEPERPLFAIAQAAPYRSSLQAAIWRREY